MTSFFDDTIGFFASKTTMHGVKNLVEADSRIMRLMWALVTIAAFSFAIWNGKLKTSPNMRTF